MKAPRSVVELACELIRIPSVNPSGDPGTPHTGEAEIARWLTEFLTLCGAEVETPEIAPGRPNVIARFPGGAKNKPALVFAPHTDTVGVAGMTIDPFGAEIRDGRIYGRGSCDTKGPMAAQLWAIWEMRHRLADLSHEIWFAGLMDEESGQLGAQAAAESLPVQFAIVGEPTGMDIVHTHKGSIWLEIESLGLAVHSSRPECGRNAIYSMAHTLRQIEEETVAQLRAWSHPILGSPTISAGVIHGGTKINVVPDRCLLEVDIRTIPGMEDYADAFAEAITSQNPHATVRILKQSLPLDTDPAHPLIGALQKTGGSLTGAPWFCDAAVFAAQGIPAIAIGPGSIAQAHTADEYLEIAALEDGARRFRDFLAAL